MTMSKGSSDRKINYNLRPSKSIERKMILEVLKEVCTPSQASNYQYIGFGSSFFTDFKLLHRSLNIDDMISLEGKKSNENRVNFNKPYACIKIVLESSQNVLPKLKWDKKSIVWLDYETGLKNYMFEDISTCTRNLKPGSFLIVTLRRDFDESIRETKEKFEAEFAQNAPVDLKLEDLEPSKSASTIKKMFTHQIQDILRDTYAAYKDSGKKVLFKPLFDFTYQDEARMYTFGGMFIAGNEEELFAEYNFNNLEFIGSKAGAFDISFPIITNKEYHFLNSFLPTDKEAFLKKAELEFIPKEHRESYYNTYKFYPAYIEITDM